MKYYISVDGGGTKIKAILFDENLNLISCAASGSVNPNFSSQEMIQKNIEQCFAELLHGLNICEAACLYVSTVGQAGQIAEALRNKDNAAGKDALDRHFRMIDEILEKNEKTHFM